MIALGFAEPMWLLAVALAPLWHAFDRARSRRAPDVAESWIGPRRERLAPPRRDARREATARMAATAALSLVPAGLKRGATAAWAMWPGATLVRFAPVRLLSPS